MPLLVKAGDLTQGHNGYPPIAAVAINAVGTVFAEGISIVCTGDAFGTHTLPSVPPITEAVVAGVGSPDVFINGVPIWRKGDPTLCGDTGNSLVGTVYVNGN